MSHRASEIKPAMKNGRKDRVWRHNQKKNMHCGRCGGHVDGLLKREGPKWVFHCLGGHHVFKDLTKDKQMLLDEGLIHKGGLADPRYDARRAAIRDSARQAAEGKVYGERFKEIGHHDFI